jgi:hypothetical protein
MAQSQKDNFRSALKDFFHGRNESTFDSLKDFQRSQWMIRAYLELILRVINPGIVPEDPEDLEACLTDQAGDSAVDFFYRNEGHVIIIQAKYRSQGKSESEHEFIHFADVLRRLHPLAGKEFKVSEKIREKAAEIDWENDTFDLQYITLAKKGDNIIAIEKKGQSKVQFAEGLEDRVELTCYDENNLNERLREAVSAGQQILKPIKLRFSKVDEQQPWLHFEDENDNRSSYIGYINAGDLRNLYQSQKYRLFSQNIRNYVGDTSTNKQIIKTAMESPQDFFFFNNGISAIATKITPEESSSSLICERFSIINGAQTVRSLAKAHVKEPLKAKEAYVLARITEVHLSDDEFLDSITRFNNTQNAVKISDFRSNDPIQIALAKKFGSLSRGGRQYWYKNKRSSDTNPRKISIGMEELTKALHAFRFGPHDSYGGSSYLFGTGKEEGYVRIFGENGVAFETLTDEKFSYIAGIWFITEKSRDLLKKEIQQFLADKDEEEQGQIRHALEQRWMVYSVIGELLRKRYLIAKRNLMEDVAKLSKPIWLDEAGGPSAALKKYVKTACEFLIRNYINGAKSPSFVHRNWFRDKKTMEGLRTEIEYMSTFIEPLPLLK